jgi:hypothetical protein
MVIDGDHSCYFCHRPLYWDEPTTFRVCADGSTVEVHSECKIKYEAEHPRDPDDSSQESNR